LSEDPPQLGPAEAPVGLARLVVKSLAKDPKERFQSFREFSAELTQWRRRYEVETRTLAKGVAKTVEQLLALAEAEQTAAEPLNVSAESTVSAVLAQLGDGYPDLVAHGAEALRNGQWYRVDVDEIARRVAAVRKDLEPRVATLRTAAQELAAATSQLEAGDARAALVGLDRVLRRVPAANLDSLVARTRKDAAEQQARDDKVRSLLVEAASAHGQGRLQTAQTLAEHALSVDAHNRQARDFLLQVQLDIAVAEADKARRCERCIERARSALKDGHLEEAERQVQLAVDTGSPHPDIATLGAAVAEAKLARDHADAWIEEIAREIALARSEFQTVDRKAAIARLEALVSKHASSAAAKGELARLQSEAQRLETVERKNAEAERLAESAAQSLANGDPQTAAELADRALELVESQQLALKTSAMAHARLRENAKRHAREERARQLVDSAKAFLSRGRYDRALRDAREAADLDPAGTDASEIIAEAVRRQTDAARALALEQDAANRAAEVRKTLAAAGAALRAKEFARARHLAEQVLAFDPNNGGCRELIAKIATAEAVAARTLEDETVDLQEGNWDPDATVVVEAATGGWMPTSVRSWWNRVRTAGSALSASIRVSSRQERRASVEVETVSADVAQRPETTHKEA
jgi:tetratricopeptide (TPR) repeat protein